MEGKSHVKDLYPDGPYHGKLWELADYEYNEKTGRATFAYTSTNDPSVQVTVTRQQWAPAAKSNWNPNAPKKGARS